MPVKETYPVGGGNALASYEYTDIEEGTGTNIYYASKTTTYTATLYQLNSQILNVDGAGVISDLGLGDASTTFTFSLSAFNLPKVIRGTAYVSFTTAFDWIDTGTETYHITIDILKNGVVVATDDTDEYADGADKVRSHLVPIDVSLTHYKKGDVLAIKLTKTSSGLRGNLRFLHDPLNRDFTGFAPNVTAADNPTQFKVLMPFRLDID